MNKEPDKLICVDLFDNSIGTATKEDCHKKGILHRAFSVFIVDGTNILLQKRSNEKYHSGGLWSNSCCSHPRFGETLEDAVARRLYEELGIECARECEEIASFVYYHRFDRELFEYEYDHVFIGKYNGAVKPNPNEIMDIKWVNMEELAESIRVNPEIYTTWFITAAPFVIQKMRGDSL